MEDDDHNKVMEFIEVMKENGIEVF
jgi:hypothetical protein